MTRISRLWDLIETYSFHKDIKDIKDIDNNDNDNDDKDNSNDNANNNNNYMDKDYNIIPNQT